jgi:O-antigen ligase
MAESQLNTPPGRTGDEAPQVTGRMPGYPKVSLFFFLTFVAFVLFRYVDGGNRVALLGAIRLEFLLGAVAIAMSIINISGSPIKVGEGRNLILFIGLLFVAMILQLPMAADPPEAQRIFTDRVFKFAMLTFLIVAMVQSPTAMMRFLVAFQFSIFYITLEATQGLITGGLVWQNQGVMRLHGAVPMYGHPNSLGGAALGALPFAVFLFFPVRHWFLRLGLVASSATAMVCVIYSGSRTSYLGLVALILWWFYQSKKKIRFVTVAVVIGAIALPLLPQEYIERFKSIGGQEAEGNSKKERILILEDAWTIFTENPLGIGVGSFPAARSVRFGRSQDTHNLYLEVATNLGFQGLIVFLGMVLVMMVSFRHSAKAFEAQRRRLVRVVRSRNLPPAAYKQIRKHEQDLAFLYATAQATAGFIIIRMVLGLFGMDLYEIYWWFASGVAIALAGLVLTSNRKTRFFEQATAQVG